MTNHAMEYLNTPMGLMFRWPEESKHIEIGRSEFDRTIWDQIINLSGKEVVRRYGVFRAEIKQWIISQLPEVTTENIRDLADGFGSSNLVYVSGSQELHIRNKLDPEGYVLLTSDEVRGEMTDDDMDADGNITDTAVQRLTDAFNACEDLYKNIV